MPQEIPTVGAVNFTCTLSYKAGPRKQVRKMADKNRASASDMQIFIETIWKHGKDW